jgi:hypothetical protein
MSDRLNEDPDPSHEQALRLSLYETIAGRRAAYDTMLWQAPVLSLTAQAFLSLSPSAQEALDSPVF